MRTTIGALIFAVLVLPCLAKAPGTGAADTKEDRIKAAQRYLKVVPMAAMMKDTAEAMAKKLPPDEAAKMIKVLTTKLDIKALEDAAVKSLVKHMTAKEINALAEFYGTPEGRSIMKKFGAYMADLQPTILREVEKAMKKKD